MNFLNSLLNTNQLQVRPYWQGSSWQPQELSQLTIKKLKIKSAHCLNEQLFLGKARILLAREIIIKNSQSQSHFNDQVRQNYDFYFKHFILPINSIKDKLKKLLELHDFDAFVDFLTSCPNLQELSLIFWKMSGRQLFLKITHKYLESKIVKTTCKMHQLSNHSQTCLKHKKHSSILVVPLAKYICEDCAIFEPAYRQQSLLQRQSIEQQVEHISKQFKQMFQQENSIAELSHKKMNVLIRSIENLQVSLINTINNQFLDIKTGVSDSFKKSIEGLQRGERSGREKLLQIFRETSHQEKIRKHYKSQKQMVRFRESIQNEMVQIQKVFLTMKKQIEENITLKVDVLSSFKPLLKLNISENGKQVRQPQKIDSEDNLLDFSEYSISHYPVFEPYQISQQSSSPVQSAPFMKRNNFERMKTAICLEDSVCSVESLSKSIQSQAFTIAISQIDHKNNTQSLLSDRSISCSSTLSKQQIPLPVTHANKEARQLPKKSVIQITSAHQLQTKLLSISPTIKSIRLSNIQISSQEFSHLLKEKISRSFIHTLQISHCPKLNDKILFDLKTHKSKTLKKVEIKDCKEFNWSDKKVKEILKKLQNEGIKLIY